MKTTQSLHDPHKIKFQVSERLIKTKPKGWEKPIQEKNLKESFRNRYGENGLFIDSGPLAVSDSYYDAAATVDARGKGIRFKTVTNRSGREGLFHLESSWTTGCTYEPVDICMQRLKREQLKDKGKVHHSSTFMPSGLYNDKDRGQFTGKDIYLVEVDSSTDKSVIQQKLNERNEERINRIKYLRSMPMVQKNMKTNPGKLGTYGCIGTTIGRFPCYICDFYDNPKILQKKELELHHTKIGPKKPFISKPHLSPEGTFTLIKNLYPTDVVFKDKPFEITPKFKVTWKHPSLPKIGGSGYATGTFARYPDHFIPNKIDEQPSKKFKTPWICGKEAKSVPSPSIRLNKINIMRRK